MKDARTKRLQKRMEPDSHLGTAVFGATTVSGATALALTARNTAWGTALVNTTLPTLIDICAFVGAADVVVSLGRLIATHGARAQCKATVKNIGKLQQITRVVKPQSAEDKAANALYADYIKKLKGLETVDNENLTPILRSIFIDNPNRLQQDVLNNLSFRDLTGEHAVKGTGGEVVFDGAKLDETLDYGLSTVYNVIKLRALLQSAKDSYKGKKKDEGKEVALDKLVGTGTEAEKTKLLKQLGHIGITPETVLKIEEIDRIIDLIDVYLKPLESLHEELGTNKDGSVRSGLFLEEYRLRGKNYQNFGDMFREGRVGNEIINKLIAAHAATMDDEDGEEFATSMREKAAKVNGDIDELGFKDADIIELRKKMKHNREYVADIHLSKEQRALLSREYYLKRNKELNAHFKNGFITLDWVKDVLTTGVEHNKGDLKKQYKLALKICDLAGISKSKVKAAIKDGSIETLLQKPELKAVVDDIAKGIDFASLTGKRGSGTNTQYLITGRYKLKKYNTNGFFSRRRALKKVYKSLPEYKKVAKHNQLLGLIKPLGKKIGFGTIAGLTLGAGLIGAAFTGVGLPIAIALGAAGVALTGVTVASRIHQAITGKKFFRIKTDAYEDKAEYAEWKKQNPSKNFAPKQSVTTPRFRNNVVSMTEGKLKTFGKRLMNAIGWSNFGKPKADEIQFGVTGDSESFEYPHSLISAYEVDGALDGAKDGIRAAIKKSVARGLRHNSEVNFLVDPIEVYIRDQKGKVKAAVHVDQKSLAKDVLSVLLEQYGTSSDTTFDVNVGKTHFIIQPSEITAKDNSGAIDPERLRATVKRITGYAREEEFRRTIPELYGDVYRNPEAFGIELDDEGAVIGNHDLAQSVNFNATRFGDGEQLYKHFKFKPIDKKAKAKTKGTGATGASAAAAEAASADADDADGLRAGGARVRSAAEDDLDDDEEAVAGRRTVTEPKTLEEALYLWAHDPENMRKYREAREYFDGLLHTERSDEFIVHTDDASGADDKDKDLPDSAKQLKAIAEKLANLQERFNKLTPKDGSTVASKEEIDKLASTLAAINAQIKLILPEDDKVDPKAIDTAKVKEISDKLDIISASIEKMEKELAVKPAETEKPKETKPDAELVDVLKGILSKLDVFAKAVEGVRAGAGADKGKGGEETPPDDIDALINKLKEEIAKLGSKGATASTDNAEVKKLIDEASQKIIDAINATAGDTGAILEAIAKITPDALPDDLIDQIVNKVLNGLRLTKEKQKQIDFAIGSVKTISRKTKEISAQLSQVYSALNLDKGADANAIAQILAAINSIHPGEAFDASTLQQMLRELGELTVTGLDELRVKLFGGFLGKDGNYYPDGDDRLLIDSDHMVMPEKQITYTGAINDILKKIDELKTSGAGVGVDEDTLKAVVREVIKGGFEQNDDGKEIGWLGGAIKAIVESVVTETALTEEQKAKIELIGNISSNVTEMKASLDKICGALKLDEDANALAQILAVLDPSKKEGGEEYNSALFSEIEKIVEAKVKASKGLTQAEKDNIFNALNVLLGKKEEGRKGGAIAAIQTQLKSIEDKLGTGLDETQLQNAIKAAITGGFAKDGAGKETGWFGTLIESLTVNAKLTEKSRNVLVNEIVDKVKDSLTDLKLDFTEADAQVVVDALERAGYKKAADEIQTFILAQTKDNRAAQKQRATQYLSSNKGKMKTLAGYEAIIAHLQNDDAGYNLTEDEINAILALLGIKKPEPPKDTAGVKELTYEEMVAKYFTTINAQKGKVEGESALNERATAEYLELTKRIKTSTKVIDTLIAKVGKSVNTLIKARNAAKKDVLYFREVLYGSTIVPVDKKGNDVSQDARIAMVKELMTQVEDKKVDLDVLINDLKDRLKQCNVTEDAIKELLDKAELVEVSDIVDLLDKDGTYVGGNKTAMAKAKQLADEIAAINKQRKGISVTH